MSDNDGAPGTSGYNSHSVAHQNEIARHRSRYSAGDMATPVLPVVRRSLVLEAEHLLVGEDDHRVRTGEQARQVSQQRQARIRTKISWRRRLIDALEAEERGARDALAQAFEEQKKYEQVAETARTLELKETARRESAAMDELGLRKASGR